MDKNSPNTKEIISKNQKNYAIKISILNVLLNILLAFIKFVAGIFGNSYALVADSIHSLSDVFVGLIVLLGVIVASKPPDKKYEFGYKKLENVFAIILSFILFDVGIFIGYKAIVNIFNKSYLSQGIPSFLALAISIISIIIKLFMFSLSLIVSKKLSLSSLKADAWHQLSDALSSIGTFLGVLGAMLGLEIMDIIVGLLICIVIIKASFDIFIDSIRKITDHSAGEKLKEQIEKKLKSIFEIEKIKSIKTKISANEIDVEIEVFINNTSLKSAGRISKKIKNKIYELDKRIKNCYIILSSY